MTSFVATEAQFLLDRYGRNKISEAGYFFYDQFIVLYAADDHYTAGEGHLRTVVSLSFRGVDTTASKAWILKIL